MITINFEANMVWNKKLTVLLIGIIACVCSVQAQVKILRGVILDKQSDEPIPYASAVFKKSGAGVLSDSLGKFILELKSWPVGDTLVVNNVGYKPTLIPFTDIKDSASITIYIEVLPPQHEAVVKVKYNRALWFWRRIIAHKSKNDKHHWDNYGYEVYNKLELDLNNVNKEKLEKNFVLKKQLGATYQNVDVYNNSIPVFDKAFISPLADNADNFYTFHLLDTQYMNKKRLVHLSFTPKRTGENTFDGDCWVNDTTYAIQKITMRPSLDVNINFVTGLSLIQEFKLINDTTWFLYKDKFVVDLAPIGQNRVGFKGRKTTTYRNIIVNSDSVIAELNKSKSNEDIILVPKTQDLPDSFWTKNRFEPLNKNEQNIYTLLDTLLITDRILITARCCMTN